MTRHDLQHLFSELKTLYNNEGCRNFDSGFDAILRTLNDSSLSDTSKIKEAGSLYRTMAGSKSGFSDIYIDHDSHEMRMSANARLDTIRQLLWEALGQARKPTD